MGLDVLAWVILAAPLAGTVLIAFLSQVVPWKLLGWLGTLAIGVAFAATIGTVADLQSLPEDRRQVVLVGWDYAKTVGVDGEISLLIDPLSMLMALVVTGVSALIHLYSVSYMASDRGYARFFAYLNFFVFSMLILVLAGNFLLLIVGWAFVGAASYLLISFWFRRRTATRAGIKAFVINVVGDMGLVLGTYFIFKGTGTLDFVKTFERVDDVFATNDGDLVAGCLLLLVGAFAKSAQIPLHTWLPDAMEGPTPVSALIHAATMVTAGVYLIARMHPLFEQAPAAADVGAILGALTLIVAATIGLVVTDLKRVIAYSTMSQIGYMIMAVSSFAYTAGLFHLMTHAFFKALLFMAAGSVIAAMAGMQDLDRMGGFRKAMPFTYGCMIVGGLALAGVPPFSGFFSKDEILAYVGARGDWYAVLMGVGLIGAFMTAVYTFRMIFRAFHNEPVPEARHLADTGHVVHPEVHVNPADGEEEDTDTGFPGPDHHIAEHEWTMKAAMGLLAVGAVFAGALQIPHVTKVLHDFLQPAFEESRYFEALEPSDTLTYAGMAVGGALSLLGVALAYLLYVRDRDRPAAIRERLRGAHRLFVNKWYFDEIIDWSVVRPMAAFGRFARDTFERLFVSGLLVGGTSGLVRAGSAAVRALQSGFLRVYASLLLLGLVAVTLYFLVSAS